ncbi:TPA: hypothetical protein KQB57_001409 [Clostridioides difficile]|uniref:hypothetical protein n=1 Tax=Clostridioides difficile TaxID=1496 RepID=UPI00016C65DA|nr:hypothetical protein [Clostridioides difficile]AXU86094.1 hypothetical protein CDIF29745_01256 [Clostridioides difficile]EGT3682280.1 hypothetical protein [Clostridioides difficile]EGT3810274.1 hypothetical protein [Clostridioides difficile]EGT3866648.1 hypothetical protein [Clostridioides difficile]EGT4629600.1 hypothetical protein [Clostridioides difficile]
MNKDIEFIACSMRLKILIQAREDLIENINKYSTKSYEKNIDNYKKLDMIFEDAIKFEAILLSSLK